MSKHHLERILAHLHDVELERQRRLADPALAQRCHSLKLYQQQRFRNSYADLIAQKRYAGATRFFLEQLYGPGDFTGRDAQFARAVPAMSRLVPESLMETVAKLAELHALSEVLDTQMAEQLPSTEDAWSASAYTSAWQHTGSPERRYLQIELTLGIGAELDRLTRKPLLRQTLRLMRGPASAAGLHDLQTFLELGFDTFHAMKGAEEFLEIVKAREYTLAKALFELDVRGLSSTQLSVDGVALQALP